MLAGLRCADVVIVDKKEKAAEPEGGALLSFSLCPTTPAGVVAFSSSDASGSLACTMHQSKASGTSLDD